MHPAAKAPTRAVAHRAQVRPRFPRAATAVPAQAGQATPAVLQAGEADPAGALGLIRALVNCLKDNRATHQAFAATLMRRSTTNARKATAAIRGTPFGACPRPSA